MTRITKDEVTRMAGEAGMNSLSLIDIGYLASFANVVLERAAVECESGVNTDDDWDSFYWDDACMNRALAIRALKINTGD